MIGIDESGSGAFVGSMFVSGVHVENIDEIKAQVKDSKELSNKEIFRKAKKLYNNKNVSIAVIEVTPQEMDEEKFPEVLYKSHSQIINLLNKQSDTVILDSPLSTEKKFAKEVALRETNESKILSRNHADSIYDIVSCASIIATQRRKQHVKQLKNDYGEIGSGYPGDKKTKEFVRDYFTENENAPDIVRKKCSTYQDIKSNL